MVRGKGEMEMEWGKERQVGTEIEREEGGGRESERKRERMGESKGEMKRGLRKQSMRDRVGVEGERKRKGERERERERERNKNPLHSNH